METLFDTWETVELSEFDASLRKLILASSENDLNPEFFNFIDGVAQILGDVIGAACNNKLAAIERFAKIMAITAQQRMDVE